MNFLADTICHDFETLATDADRKAYALDILDRVQFEEGVVSDIVAMNSRVDDWLASYSGI
ncbi:hypothetical protein [Mesorhizobium escarrei]|uniref:Uncharacterized protein n=1 Tax=Mesorhizobium escarrei TaxID=666018 RepID=A0ABM9DSI4_9HYPH|nr:hypothetical protein [Mesorhizobium escarrei]CAH2399621.1 hypothetical protein MES5069_230039 [Mesorhizobium escarrei]